MKNRAIITGASRRLGLSLTSSLLKDGWEVVALTRGSSKELDQLQCDSLKIHQILDLDNPSFENTIKQLSKTYDAVDLIVHNASSYEVDPAENENISEFYTFMFKIHMLLPAIINTHFEKPLQNASSKNPNIIHITDIYADNPNVKYTLYCSTKAGLENLGKGFAKRFAPKIRVNTIQPGPIKFLPDHSDKHKERVLKETLLAFEAGFEPILKTVNFIIDNTYLTGSTIKVDGGRSITKL